MEVVEHMVEHMEVVAKERSRLCAPSFSPLSRTALTSVPKLASKSSKPTSHKVTKNGRRRGGYTGNPEKFDEDNTKAQTKRIKPFKKVWCAYIHICIVS